MGVLGVERTCEEVGGANIDMGCEVEKRAQKGLKCRAGSERKREQSRDGQR